MNIEKIRTTLFASTVAIGGSLLLYNRLKRKTPKEEKSFPSPKHRQLEESKIHLKEISDNQLSKRGQSVISDKPISYLQAHMARDPKEDYSSTNPDGYVNLSVAENKLLFDLMKDKLKDRPEMSVINTSYDGIVTQTFKHTVAKFLSTYVIKREIDPSHIVCTNGAGPAIELLIYAICNPKDGVLLTTPFYAGFAADCTLRTNCEIIPAHMPSETGFQMDIKIVDKALEDAYLKGVKVKCMIVCSPNNPLGVTYSRQEIETLLEWAKDKDIHLIFDEVYALSVHGNKVPFVSVGEILSDKQMKNRIHLIYSASKDFCLSGFRIGFIHTTNENVLRVLNCLNFFAAPSSDSTFWLGNILSDTKFLNTFIDNLQSRLSYVYKQIENALIENKIPFLACNSGIFVMIDLRTFLSESTFEAEDELFKYIVKEAKVNISPGASMHCVEPGWFRMCYATYHVSVVVAAIFRLRRCLDKKSQQKQ